MDKQKLVSAPISPSNPSTSVAVRYNEEGEESLDTSTEDEERTCKCATCNV